MLPRLLSYQEGISRGVLNYKTHLEFSVKQFDSRVNHDNVLIMQYLVRIVNITHGLTNMLIVQGTGNDIDEIECILPMTIQHRNSNLSL